MSLRDTPGSWIGGCALEPGDRRAGVRLRAARAVRPPADVEHARARGRLDPARDGAHAQLPRRLSDRLSPAGVGQPNEFQRVALAVTGVPDGSPTQPSASSPFCVGRAGGAGDDRRGRARAPVRRRRRVQRECRSVGAGLDCQAAGASTAGAFSVDVHVAPAQVGEPQSFRVTPLTGEPVRRRSGGSAAGRLPRRPLRAQRDRGGRRVRHRRGGRAGGDLRPPRRGRAGVPAPGAVDVRRARRGRGLDDKRRHGHVRHAVVGAAARRRAQRLPPPHRRPSRVPRRRACGSRSSPNGRSSPAAGAPPSRSRG